MKQRAKKKGKPASKSRPSSSSITNEAGLQPLFVVLFSGELKPHIRILQLEIPAKSHKEKVYLNKYVASFDLKELTGSPMNWLFSPPTRSTSVMYIMPDRALLRKSTDKPLHGYEFSLRTRECRQVKPVTCSKVGGLAVNCKGRIYLMEDLRYYDPEPHPTFECYDPDKGKWEALSPFPFDATGKRFGYDLRVQAIAVWGDTLVHFFDCCELWAYNVTKNKWYRVQATDEDNEIGEENRCYTIHGRAIVIENSIYALSIQSDDFILELSIECHENDDDDLVYKCAVSSIMCIPDLYQIGNMDELAYMWQRRFVHLGKDEFCLVQCSFTYADLRFQPIYLTILKLKELEGGGKSMAVTSRHTYDVEIKPRDLFEAQLCFSLPKSQTMITTKPGKTFNFYFDLEAEIQEPVQEPGNYIYVSNLPPEVTEDELEDAFMNFGPITMEGIRIRMNETGEFSASIEFESDASKQSAIEASTITIGGCCAEIKGKKAEPEFYL